jgi:sporulation protein YlmC with PRC-barrel domain
MNTRAERQTGAANPSVAEPRIVGSGQGDGPGPRLMTAATLIGDDIVNPLGEKLGRLHDIMLDVPNGRIAYAVLSTGGVLGVGERLFAVPWQMLQLNTDDRNMILDIAKERIELAPGFDKNQWPSMADPTWGTQVHDYYGVRPYWE